MFYGLILLKTQKTHRIYLILVKRRSVCLQDICPSYKLEFCTDTWNFSDVAQCPEERVSFATCKSADVQESKT